MTSYIINLIVVVLVVLSGIWVYWDATEQKIGKMANIKSMFNISAGGWATVTLMLWIVAFPAYLIKRKSLIEIAKSQPVEVKGRFIKLAIITIIGMLWVSSFILSPTKEKNANIASNIENNQNSIRENKESSSNDIAPHVINSNSDIKNASEVAEPVEEEIISNVKADDYEEMQQQVISPSFDCAKASIDAEHLICSNSELATLDVDLMQAYKGLQSVYPNKQQLKKEQNDWMKKERNICTTTDCMMEAYRSRIDDLETTRKYLSKPVEFR